MNSCETIPGNENAVSLASVFTTAELNRRPSRSPDFAAENRALVALAQVMAGSPDRILQKLAETALNLCRAHSAGFSLLELDGRRFYSPVIIGQWACHMGAGTLVDSGPFATVLDRNAPQLMSRPERHFTHLASVKPPIEEVLIVPFYLEGKAIGTIWVMSHDETLRFDAEDLRVMANLGAFAATAYQVMLDSAERLREANADVASRLAQIEKVNAEVQDSRRAALNVMEDALRAREIAETLNLQLLNEVAERRQTEATLRESEERYRILFTLGPVAVYSCDASGVIRDFNPRATELWGRTPKPGDTDERFCGSYKLHRPDGTFMPHDQSPMAEVLSGQIPEVRDGEVHIERPDGSRVVVIVNIRPLNNQGGEITGALNYFFDITDRKRAEQERQDLEKRERGLAIATALRETEAELARVARALTVGELATSIAHEVNQPLAAIVTNAEACIRWLDKTPNLHEAEESLALIIRDGNRASEVIRRIREFLKKDSRQLAQLDINDVALDAVALVRDELLKRHIALRVELSDDLPPVQGDRIQLQQVILNLIMNGGEAMASVADGSRELAVMSQKFGTDDVLMAVRDSGTGMDAQNIDRMFDAFFTTKPTGMGMGLSISRSIIEAHGGRIWAALNDGPGLTVQFSLPARTENPS